MNTPNTRWVGIVGWLAAGGLCVALAAGGNSGESRPAALGTVAGVDWPPAPQEEEILDEVFQKLPGVPRDDTLAIVREHLPERLSEFRRLAMLNRDEAGALLRVIVRDALELSELRRRNPTLFARTMEEQRLGREAAALAEAARHASGRERDELREKLRLTLDRAFEVRQELMRADAQRLQAEIDKLKSLVDKRQRHRDAIVTRRLGELTGEVEIVRW
jgi:hypothetical protein